LGSYLQKLLSIQSLVKGDALIEIRDKQRPQLCCICGGQKAGAEVFRADGVGLFLLVVFALIVPVQRHRKRETDYEREQGQRCGLYNIEIFTHPVFRIRHRCEHNTPSRDESARIKKEIAKSNTGELVTFTIGWTS